MACKLLLSLAVAALALACVASTARADVQCFVEPCSTPSCKAKCAGNYQCQNNYTTGCDCECVPMTGNGVQCLVAPCSTLACQQKCGALGYNYQCQDNYTTGCNCDCITKANNGAQCLVAPCSTQACKDKCGLLGSNFQCKDNYATGCDCDCVPKTGNGVQCLVAPCSTPECKDKCAAYGTGTQCIDDYSIGCNCNCLPSAHQCIAPKEICSTNKNATKCCARNICDFTNACINNPQARCATVCVDKEDSASHCKKSGQTCSPSSIQCCSGYDCRPKPYYKKYTCQKCKTFQEPCTVNKNECCGPKLTCKPDVTPGPSGKYNTPKGKCQYKQL